MLEKSTMRQIARSYVLAKSAYKKEVHSGEAIKVLISECNMDSSTANAAISSFACMMAGMHYDRDLDVDYLEYYLKAILCEFGKEDLKKALKAIEKSLDGFLKLVAGDDSKYQFPIRALHNSFTRAVGISPVYEASPPYKKIKGNSEYEKEYAIKNFGKLISDEHKELINNFPLNTRDDNRASILEKNEKDLVIDNAFDFLKQAIDQFDKQPKYSVINFCASVELFLKVRLIHEHWSLIFDTRNKNNLHPSIGKFKSGDFKSLNSVDIIDRIESIADEKFSDEFKKYFSQLSRHRNQMIHFFHKPSDESEKKRIAVEQSFLWELLKVKLKEDWSKIFHEYFEEIDVIDDKIKKYESYWRAIFERKKGEIEVAKKGGALVSYCMVCHQQAFASQDISETILKNECIVCDRVEYLCRVECDTCGNKQLINDEDGEPIDGIYCYGCGEEIEKKQIEEQLNSMHYKEYYIYGDSSCGRCEAIHSVVYHYDYYICIECFLVVDKIEHCDWCGEGQIGGGLSSNSSWDGCVACFGRKG